MKSTDLGVSDRSTEAATRKQKMSCCYSLLRETNREDFSCKEIKPVNPKRKKINPEYSLTGLKLKPKHQYFGHLMQRGDSLEKTLMLGKTEGRRRRR